MLNTKNPLKNENDIIIGTFAYCIDITKQLSEIKHLLESGKNISLSQKTLLTPGSYILNQNIDNLDFLNTQLDLLAPPNEKIHLHSYNQLKDKQDEFPIDNNIFENLTKYNLTSREYICLFYLLRGRTAQEIAATLFLSIRTIEKRIDQIKDKLNYTTRSQLIDIAIKEGFINIIFSD